MRRVIHLEGSAYVEDVGAHGAEEHSCFEEIENGGIMEAGRCTVCAVVRAIKLVNERGELRKGPRILVGTQRRGSSVGVVTDAPRFNFCREDPIE